VRIKQRNPIVRIMSNNNNQYYIDEQGFLMPLSPNYTARVLIVTGYVDKAYKDYKTNDLTKLDSDTLLRNIFLLSKKIKENKYWSAMCDQVYVNKKHELIIIPKIGAKQILLGKETNYTKDLNTLTTFYKEVLPLVGWEKYKTINLQYNQQIVCK